MSSSYNYPSNRDRAHSSRSYSSDHQPQGPPPSSSNRNSSFKLNHLLNSDDQPLPHSTGHFSLPPLSTSHAAPYPQSISFSYTSQASSSPHYRHNHNDYSNPPTPALSHPLQSSITPLQRLAPYNSNAPWDYTEPSRQLPNTPFKLDHATPPTLTFFHPNANQNAVSQEALFHQSPVMSISGILSKDTNDGDYSFQKPQKDSNSTFEEGALGGRGGRSNLNQVQTTDSAEDKDSEASISDANSDASLPGSDQSEGESSDEGPRSPSMIVPPPPRKIPEPGNGLVVKLKTNSSSRPPSVSSTCASQEPDTSSKVNLMSQVLQFPQIDKIERHAASHSSDSSAESDVDLKTKRGSSESSESGSESESDIGEEERFDEELVNYMVEVYKRQKRVIDDYERRCRIKKDILRRKFSTRVNYRISSKSRILDKENNTSMSRGIRGIRHRMEIKRMTRKLHFEYSNEFEGGNDEQKRATFGTRIQKQREALESEERRRIWKDIVRNAIPRMNKIVSQTTSSRSNNCRKIALLCQKEARKAACKSCKSTKDIQTRSRQAMRQMLFFWKRNEKEERELRKKAEREALERMRVEEEMREAKRQARKLNFLITQTELYSHFVGKKIGTQNAEENAENAAQVDVVAGEQGTSDQGTEFSSTDLNLEIEGISAPTSFEDIDFDEEDEDALREKARASAKNALAQVKKHTRDFDGDRSGKPADIELSNEDLDQMNFQNPSSMPSMSEIKQPTILVKVTLKDYQLKGLNWLANLYEQGINGILADEMGLGKTVQSISLMAHLAETHNIWGPFLVIAPASTLHNWQKEIAEFLPTFKILPYWGTPKDRVILRKSLNKKNLIFNKDTPFHVVITSYQLIVQDQSYFARTKWQYMILDEAQAIKSSSSARWKTLLGFQCRNRLLLTGTPIQNSMQELWALLHFIMPTLFDSHQEFSEWFSKDIESHAENKGSLNEHQLKRLHMILKPFMLRRVKKNVQNELGEKIEREVFCHLTARQRVLYRGLREKISVAELLEKAATLPDNDNVDSLMNLVMQFRKVCNHPELFERADVVSPFSFCYFSATWLISREEYLYLPYSSRNYITYEIPKTVYRNGGLLDIPGYDSQAGSRTNVLDHMMNIWRPDYIHQSLCDEHSDTFTFLKFTDTTPAEASNIFFGHLVQRWILHLLQKKHRSRRRFYITQDDESYPNSSINTYAMFLINDTAPTLSPMNVENSPALSELANIFENTTQYELVVLDMCYMPKAIAPPIQPVCVDKCFYNDQESLLFDSSIRTALFGIVELLPQGERMKNSIVQLLTQSEGDGMIGKTYRKDRGFSYMRVPPLKKLVLDSGKLTKLDELLKELKAGGHRVLIYFQMTRMIDLMEEYLAYRQYKYLRLDGSSKIHDRRDMVEDWQTRSEIFVFLLSTRAGGLGINLTAADTVIFYDSDWNPTVDQQAMDRAHRLGQTKQVTVYRLITKGTIEERILQRAKQKDEIQKVVISGGEFKQVDFKPREIVSLLLEDDELETKLKEQQSKRRAEEEENKKKVRGNKRRKKETSTAAGSSGSSFKTLEELWHEGEPPMVETEGSGVTTPSSSVGGTKKKRTPKAPAKPRAKKAATTRSSRSTRSKSNNSESMDVEIS